MQNVISLNSISPMAAPILQDRVNQPAAGAPLKTPSTDRGVLVSINYALTGEKPKRVECAVTDMEFLSFQLGQKAIDAVRDVLTHDDYGMASIGNMTIPVLSSKGKSAALQAAASVSRKRQIDYYIQKGIPFSPTFQVCLQAIRFESGNCVDCSAMAFYKLQFLIAEMIRDGADPKKLPQIHRVVRKGEGNHSWVVMGNIERDPPTEPGKPGKIRHVGRLVVCDPWVILPRPHLTQDGGFRFNKAEDKIETFTPGDEPTTNFETWEELKQFARYGLSENGLAPTNQDAYKIAGSGYADELTDEEKATILKNALKDNTWYLFDVQDSLDDYGTEYIYFKNSNPQESISTDLINRKEIMRLLIGAEKARKWAKAHDLFPPDKLTNPLRAAVLLDDMDAIKTILSQNCSIKDCIKAYFLAFRSGNKVAADLIASSVKTFDSSLCDPIDALRHGRDLDISLFQKLMENNEHRFYNKDIFDMLRAKNFSEHIGAFSHALKSDKAILLINAFVGLLSNSNIKPEIKLLVFNQAILRKAFMIAGGNVDPDTASTLMKMCANFEKEQLDQCKFKAPDAASLVCQHLNELDGKLIRSLIAKLFFNKIHSVDVSVIGIYLNELINLLGYAPPPGQQAKIESSYVIDLILGRHLTDEQDNGNISPLLLFGENEDEDFHTPLQRCLSIVLSANSLSFEERRDAIIGRRDANSQSLLEAAFDKGDISDIRGLKAIVNAIFDCTDFELDKNSKYELLRCILSEIDSWPPGKKLGFEDSAKAEKLLQHCLKAAKTHFVNDSQLVEGIETLAGKIRTSL